MLITCEVLQYATTLFIVYYKTLYSMNTFVLLHFEHKIEITIIIKLHRATRLQLAALCIECVTLGSSYNLPFSLCEHKAVLRMASHPKPF